MGYHKLPSWKNYCNIEPDFSVSFISNALPCSHFLQILSNIHVNDYRSVPKNNSDKLYKLRPHTDHSNMNYMKLYKVSKQVIIDESMILFKERSSFKQYNPMKPIKRGYKLSEMADMDGYLYKFQVYQGKCENKSIQNLPKFIGLGDRIICQMTVSLHKKYYEVYAANFFTYVPLMVCLSSNKLLVVQFALISGKIISLSILFLISIAHSLLMYNVKIEMVVCSPCHVQKLFPTIIHIWEEFTKLICFALCMTSTQNRKNGGTVFFWSSGSFPL